jgi:hypothetical protein
MKLNRWLMLTGLAAAVMTACAGPLVSNAQVIETPTPDDDAPTLETTPLPGNLDTVTFIEDNQQYSISQLLPRDGIAPIYDPHFTSAELADYEDNELVMGVEINGDARAYPVGFLQHREMVDDVVGGTPILVSW